MNDNHGGSVTGAVRKSRSERTLRRWSCAVAEGAVIASAMANLLATVPAGALPPVPLGPACLGWTYTGPMNIHHSDGAIVGIDKWWGDSAGTGEYQAKLYRANGQPVEIGDEFTSDERGTVTGQNVGSDINFTIAWETPDHMKNVYTGKIDDMGAASGTTTNSNGVKTSWNIQEHFTCAKQAANDPPAPAAAAAPAPAPVPVTNAIGASFRPPGLTSISLQVTNSSALTAACHYDAAAHTLDPLVPKDTQRDFTVAPHTTPANPHVETFNGAVTFTNYAVTISCTDASGQQKEPIGTVKLSQTW